MIKEKRNERLCILHGITLPILTRQVLFQKKEEVEYLNETVIDREVKVVEPEAKVTCFEMQGDEVVAQIISRT